MSDEVEEVVKIWREVVVSNIFLSTNALHIDSEKIETYLPSIFEHIPNDKLKIELEALFFHILTYYAKKPSDVMLRKFTMSFIQLIGTLEVNKKYDFLTLEQIKKIEDEALHLFGIINPTTLREFTSIAKQCGIKEEDTKTIFDKFKQDSIIKKKQKNKEAIRNFLNSLKKQYPYISTLDTKQLIDNI